MKRLIYLLIAVLFTVNSIAQTNLELAEQAIEDEDYAAVIRYTTEHLQTTPKVAEALAMRASAYVYIGDLPNAFADINAAIKCWNKKTKNITLSQLYIFRAFLYQNIDDNVAALADLNTAVNRGKKVAENYEMRADFYREQAEYALAEADYRTAAQLEPTNADYQIEIGRCMLHQQQYDNAKSYFQKLVKLYPNNEEALRLYAVTFLCKEDYRAFIDSYIEYMEMAQNPDLQPLYEAAQYEFAYTIKAVSEQVTSASDNYYWLSVRARLYREHRQFTEALADLKQVEVGLDTVQNPFVLSEIAFCYDELDNFSQSVFYYTKLIDLYEQRNVPNDVFYLKRSIAYRELGEYDKTIADCDKALAISMDYAGYAYYLRGLAHELAKDNDAAFDDYNKSILFDENYAYSYLMRGEQYLIHRQDTIHAMQDFEHILELDTIGTDGSCRHYALMFLGKTDEAKAWMAQILEAEPNNAGHYYDAACLYARMGEADEAMNFLRQAFELGFRRFHHLEADDDMDNLRNRQDYKDLVNQYKKEKLTNLLKNLES